MRYNIVVSTNVNAQPEHSNTFNREPLRPGKVEGVFLECVTEEYERIMRGKPETFSAYDFSDKCVMRATGDGFSIKVTVTKEEVK